MKFHFKLTAVLVSIYLVIATGCVKELPATNDNYEPKPVIWAILKLDSNIQIVTSGNRGLDNDDIVNITDLDMFIFEDGIKVGQLLSQTILNDSQSHFFTYKPSPNHIYSLRFSNAKTEIISKVKMLSYLLKPDSIELSKGNNAQLKYTIQDDINFIDAYQLDVEIYHLGPLTDTSTNTILNNNFEYVLRYDKYDEPTLSYNLLALNTGIIENYTFPVNDNLFNGKKKTFLFSVQNQVSDDIFIPRNVGNGTPVSDLLSCKKRYILVKCRKISPEYYNFYISESKNNAIFGTPYFNPTNVYTNITGGLGLMAAMTERIDTVWIKK